MSYVSWNKTINPNSESVDISPNNVPNKGSISSKIEDFDLQHSSMNEIFSDDEGMINNLVSIDQNTVNCLITAIGRSNIYAEKSDINN